MASSGWQTWNSLRTSSFGYDYFKCSIRIDSITHSGGTVTVSGAFGVKNDGGYSSYYYYPINAAMTGIGYQQVVAGQDWIGTNEIRTSNFTTSFSASAGSTSANVTVEWSYNNGTAYNSYTYTLYFDASYTDPSGLSVSIAEKYTNGAKFNVSLSSYGNPSSTSGRYIEAAILGSSTYGNPYRYATSSNTKTATITVNNSSSTGSTALTIQPNTQYSYGGYATNTQRNISTVTGTFVTLAEKPTLTQGTVGVTSATYNYSTAADGGKYSKKIQYSLDNGTTWVDAATISTGSASSGSFTISGLTSNTSYTVLTRMSTTSGNTTGDTLTFTTDTPPAIHKFYGSVNGVAKKVNKLYGPVEVQVTTGVTGTIRSGATQVTAFDADTFFAAASPSLDLTKTMSYVWVYMIKKGSAVQHRLRVYYSDNTYYEFFSSGSIADYATYGITASEYTGSMNVTDYIDLTPVTTTQTVAKKISKLYGSANGVAKLIFEGT